MPNCFIRLVGKDVLVFCSKHFRALGLLGNFYITYMFAYMCRTERKEKEILIVCRGRKQFQAASPNQYRVGAKRI